MKYRKSMESILFIIIILMFTFDLSKLTADSWVQKQSTPLAGVHGGLTANPSTGKIYWHRGDMGGGSNYEFYEYDIATDQWTQKTSTPVPVRACGLAIDYINDKLYLHRGLIGSSGDSTFFEYVISSDSWTEKTGTPTKGFFGGLAANPLTDKVYWHRGRISLGTWETTTDFFEYDIATDTWTQKASTPVDGAYGGGLALNPNTGKIYWHRGFYNSGFSSAFYEYDIATNTWTQKASTPSALTSGFCGALCVNPSTNKVYWCRGDSLFYEYNVATDSWTEKTHTPVRGDGGGLAANTATNKIYWHRGYWSPPGYTTEFYEYTPDVTGIEEISFYANSRNAYIALNWWVSTETNSLYQLFRKVGASDTNYTEIATIPARASSGSAQSYSYRDRNVNSNLGYSYKLKIVKTDGNTMWYGPVTATIRATKPYLEVSPNPFRNKVEIRYKIPEMTKIENRNFPISQFPISLYIYDVGGRLVRNLVTADLSTGTLMWDGRNDMGNSLPSGVYYIKLSLSKSKYIRKITKMGNQK